jgi:Ala-tRNA(Pro) deacylase
MREADNDGGTTMYVSQTVMGFLDRSGIEFDLVAHGHTKTSPATARSAHIAPERLAKAVLMRSEDDYVLAVVPATAKVNLYAMRELLDEDGLVLADESEMPFIFRDCELGALPIVGEAFGVKTAIDDALLDMDEVYFEAGDHEHLVHLAHDALRRLMRDQQHGRISFQR